MRQINLSKATEINFSSCLGYDLDTEYHRPTAILITDTRLPRKKWLNSDCSTHLSLPTVLETYRISRKRPSESPASLKARLKNVLRKL